MAKPAVEDAALDLAALSEALPVPTGMMPDDDDSAEREKRRRALEEWRYKRNASRPSTPARSTPSPRLTPGREEDQQRLLREKAERQRNAAISNAQREIDTTRTWLATLPQQQQQQPPPPPQPKKLSPEELEAELHAHQLQYAPMRQQIQQQQQQPPQTPVPASLDNASAGEVMQDAEAPPSPQHSDGSEDLPDAFDVPESIWESNDNHDGTGQRYYLVKWLARDRWEPKAYEWVWEGWLEKYGHADMINAFEEAYKKGTAPNGRRLILGRKVQNGQVQYLVQWAGYDTPGFPWNGWYTPQQMLDQAAAEMPPGEADVIAQVLFEYEQKLQTDKEREEQRARANSSGPSGAHSFLPPRTDNDDDDGGAGSSLAVGGGGGPAPEAPPKTPPPPPANSLMPTRGPSYDAAVSKDTIERQEQKDKEAEKKRRKEQRERKEAQDAANAADSQARREARGPRGASNRDYKGKLTIFQTCKDSWDMPAFASWDARDTVRPGLYIDDSNIPAAPGTTIKGLFTQYDIPAGGWIGFYTGVWYEVPDFEGMNAAVKKARNFYAVTASKREKQGGKKGWLSMVISPNPDPNLPPNVTDNQKGRPDFRRHPLAATNEPMANTPANVYARCYTYGEDSLPPRQLCAPEHVHAVDELHDYMTFSLYAHRNIRASEELFWNYGAGYKPLREELGYVAGPEVMPRKGALEAGDKLPDGTVFDIDPAERVRTILLSGYGHTKAMYPVDQVVNFDDDTKPFVRTAGAGVTVRRSRGTPSGSGRGSRNQDAGSSTDPMDPSGA